MPDAGWLIAAGILLGPVLGYLDRRMLASAAPYLAALTLVVILFEGGSRLNLETLFTAAPRAALLAVAGFVASVGVVALFTHGAALGRRPAARLDLVPRPAGGCILGGSSSVVIMPAMARARVPSRNRRSGQPRVGAHRHPVRGGHGGGMDLLNVGAASGHPLAALGRSFGVGAAVGIGAGLLWLVLLLRLLRGQEHGYVITLSALFVLYVLVNHAGGSGALAVLTFAVLLGNAPALARRLHVRGPVALDEDVRSVHRNIAFMTKSFFFTFIGAMLAPPWTLIIAGAAAAGLLFAVRQPVVWVAARGAAFDADARRMIGVCVPRGLAAGVLATLPSARHRRYDRPSRPSCLPVF